MQSHKQRNRTAKHMEGNGNAHRVQEVAPKKKKKKTNTSIPKDMFRTEGRPGGRHEQQTGIQRRSTKNSIGIAASRGRTRKHGGSWKHGRANAGPQILPAQKSCNTIGDGPDASKTRVTYTTGGTANAMPRTNPPPPPRLNPKPQKVGHCHGGDTTELPRKGEHCRRPCTVAMTQKGAEMGMARENGVAGNNRRTLTKMGASKAK